MKCFIRMSLSLTLLVISVMFVMPAQMLAGAAVEVWTQRFDGLGRREYKAAAIAVDANGNVYIVGNVFVASLHGVCATIAYSSGGAALWTNYYGGDPNETGAFAKAIAAGSNGVIYITGDFANSGTGRDYFTIAYSTAGTPLWTNSYTAGVTYEDTRAVAVGGNGNVYVTGLSDLVGSEADYATVAYSSTGLPLWTNRYNGPANNSDSPAGISVAGNGNVYVTGTSLGGSSYYDFATIAYSSSGTPLWTNRFDAGDQSLEVASGLAADGIGNAFVTGISGNSSVTIAYSSSGLPRWTNWYAGVTRAVVLDGDGNVFVTGNRGLVDYATIAYSNDGAPLWTNIYTPANQFPDTSLSLTTDRCGNAYLAGTDAGDYVTIAYSGSGAPMWTNRYGGTNSFDQAEGLATDSNGNVYVIGSSSADGVSTESDWVTVKYAPVPEFTTNHWLPDGNFSMLLAGGCSANYRVEASTNLVSWLEVTNVSTTNGTAVITDLEARNFPVRFYRAVSE